MHDRDRDTVDSELRLLAAVRRVVHQAGGPPPSIAPIDALLDERHVTAGLTVAGVGKNYA
jgi:hypothetical protein